MGFNENRRHLKKYIVESGIKDPEASERRTGRTTSKALAYISEAILNPCIPIYTKDHYVFNGQDSQKKRDRYCLDECKKIVHALSLEEFEFNYSNNTILFNLIEWSEL